MSRSRHVESDLDWLVPAGESGYDKHQVPGPPPKKYNPDQPSEKHRAAGGRVLASNINAEPTEAQKEAGNYAKDKVRVHGLVITVENAKGAWRRGVGRNGKPWQVRMPAHYGYVNGTEGADKDHVDVYLGPHIKSPHAFVVDQVDADTKKFDEHKVMLGFGSLKQALTIYKRGFSDGKGSERIGSVAALTISQLKAWLADGNTRKRLVNTP